MSADDLSTGSDNNNQSFFFFFFLYGVSTYSYHSLLFMGDWEDSE